MVELEIEDTRIYQAFYTNSIPIVSRMIGNLNLNVNDLVFEPCGGNGVFIDEILSIDSRIVVEVNELNPEAFIFLKDKYSSNKNIHVRCADTLLDEKFALNDLKGGYFDKIVANPPYGAWQDNSKRALLKKLYEGSYIKETYTLFLYRCIKLLKEGGKLAFIIPDTYLNLHMHKGVRKFILEHTKIEEILLFPSSFFPGVNFGYANLSIITLEKCSNLETCLANDVKIIRKFKDVNDLLDLSLPHLESLKANQSQILKNSDHAFLLSANDKILNIISNCELQIGDVADCVTGFYSGNDKVFLKVKNKYVRNAKNYVEINNSEIHNSQTEEISLNGLNSKQSFIPIVKGGNTKFLKQDNWFIDWSEKAVKHYKTNKKSRFQNSKFYFKSGVGVPMISSTRITGSLINNRIFDQSIVGVFPKESSLLYYLLAFFNSQTCNLLIRTINPSANNPSNYIKKIPFIIPTLEQLEEINSVVKEIIHQINLYDAYPLEFDTKIDRIFQSIYGV